MAEVPLKSRQIPTEITLCLDSEERRESTEVPVHLPSVSAFVPAQPGNPVLLATILSPNEVGSRDQGPLEGPA